MSTERLKHLGMESAYFWIVCLLFTSAFVAAALMPDTQRHGRLGGAEALRADAVPGSVEDSPPRWGKRGRRD